MGVPQLYTTLRPFAHPDTLHGDTVTIDGPALSYHVLRICRLNGVDIPSYELLTRIVVSWLDELVLRRVIIRNIYFDGYLPESKLGVRMGRMKRQTTQLHHVYKLNKQGVYREKLMGGSRIIDIDLFTSHVLEPQALIDPCFLVPAVIGALRKHDSYRSVTHIVPGEADHFCASDVREHGGTVLTSDSDLLIHDLGHARVVFFRDLMEEVSFRTIVRTFTPEKIFKAIGLKYPEKALQLAHEHQLFPNATISQIAQRCSKPPSKPLTYLNLQQRFAPVEIHGLTQKDGCYAMRLNYLDPRISEFVLTFHVRHERALARSPVRMFLPSLMECPMLKSAWAPSTAIRQLAYSVANYNTTSGDIRSVHEFRRVQNLPSLGMEVKSLSIDVAQYRVTEILLFTETRAVISYKRFSILDRPMHGSGRARVSGTRQATI